MIMLINHQPLEAYTCLLYPSEHGSLGIDRALVSISLIILLSGTLSRIFDESTFSRLLRACPRNIDGDNLAGDISFAAASLS